MHLYSEERIAIFIDGANLYEASRALGWEIDYKRLIEFFQTKAQLVRAFYYAVLPEEGDYSSLRPLLDWLSYNGFSTVTKSKPEFLDAGGRRRLKASIDVELAVDAMRFADNVDHIVLFSGDGDFRRLVAALQEKGKRVSVLSTLHREAPMVADELRRQADQFVELDDLHDQLSRKANPTRLSA